MPICNSPTEIFDYLKFLYTDKFEQHIKIDLARTCIGNESFKRPHLEGNNPLYNVVNAYAHYDEEIGYCQGMCFIAALLLHYLKNEEDAFFCLIHVLKVHDWRGCFADHTPKLMAFLEFLDGVLEISYNNIYNHIMEEIEISISPAFISNIQTIFIRDCPHKVAS